MPSSRNGKDRAYIGLVADIAYAFFVGTDAYIVDAEVVANIILEGFELHHLGAPPTMIRWQHATLHSQNTVKRSSKGRANDLLAEIAFKRSRYSYVSGNSFPVSWKIYSMFATRSRI